jgi:hypothetical protein
MRLKIGAHEFEAEGPVAVVQEQVKRFMELIASLPVEYVKDPYAYNEKQMREQSPPDILPTSASSLLQPPPAASPDAHLDKIMRLDNRVVSLTVRPDSAETAVLLLLYGQKVMRQNDGVTGAEVMDGITATGGLSVARVDRLLEKLGRDGDVIVIGEHRGKRYRLTNSGLAKARGAANVLLAIVA